MSAGPVRLLGATASLLLATAVVAVSAPEEPNLWLDKLVIRSPVVVQAAGPRPRLALRGEFDANGAHDLLTEDVVVTVGGVEVLALRDGDDRTGLREVRPLRWRYRGPREAGRPRLRVNLATGVFRLRTRGLDLGGLDADADIEVALAIGADAWCGVAAVERSARRIRLAPSPPPEQLPQSDVADVPLYVPDAVSETTVVRNADDWAALWTRLAGAGEPPPVDFATEMVLAVVVGDQGASLEYSVRIDRVVARGDDVVVKYTETFDTRHPVPAVAVTPKAVVRVPLRTGRVEFERRFVRLQ